MPRRYDDPNAALVESLRRRHAELALVASQSLPVTLLSQQINGTQALPSGGGGSFQTCITSPPVNGFLNYRISGTVSLFNNSGGSHGFEIQLLQGATGLDNLTVLAIANGAQFTLPIVATYLAPSRAINGGLQFLLQAKGDGATFLIATASTLCVEGMV